MKIKRSFSNAKGSKNDFPKGNKNSEKSVKKFIFLSHVQKRKQASQATN